MHFFALIALVALPAFAAPPFVPSSPCTVSFNGFPLPSTLDLSPYDIQDVHHLLASVADLLPEGYVVRRVPGALDASSDAPPEDFIPAAITVTIPSSVSKSNDFIAVGQVNAQEVWSAARSEPSGVLHHLVGVVEKTPLNFFAAYGRPSYVHVSLPGLAIVPQ
ncbi:hypothetical protein FA95DRAFT_1554187 [Auriscalpium vulgare]|uniref:Uncharacterized protein n=1 Tax=Auriscalpium vulgare TaxID=40419 RepID=A0ACB8S5M7_9AGAM|nr:hypothetical protein FA95DRAFT_1554187 [Auriscalpium vulgare]